MLPEVMLTLRYCRFSTHELYDASKLVSKYLRRPHNILILFLRICQSSISLYLPRYDFMQVGRTVTMVLS